MHTIAQRSSSSPGSDAMQPLVFHSVSNASKGKDKKCKKNGTKESLRRCKSTPEKKPAIQSQEKNPNAWKCVWDKERGYVAELRAKQKPTTKQPQLSYFAFLGNNCQGKGRYQTLSGDAEVVINLGNKIVPQNWSPTCPNSEEGKFQGSAIHIITEPMKPGTTQLVECCSCMCCVKALFYHCTKDSKFEKNWAEDPCVCEVPGTECMARWGILGMLSLLMPCLVCYPVIKTCCRSPFIVSGNET